MTRLEEIRERMGEIRTLLDGSEKVDLAALEQEIKDLDKEKRELQEESIRGGKTINSMNMNSGSTFTGETYEDGQKVLTRSQKLSDLYPNHDNLSLGKYLRGAITGNWSNASKEREEFRSLSTATSNVLIPKVLSSQVIDTARNQSILFQSGVPMLPMDTNNLTISKVKQDPDFEFKAEGAETTEKTMEFEPVTLQSKTVYGLVSVTLEALESSANLETIVRNTMAESIARTIDKACLFGLPENNEPKGILTYDDINLQAETESFKGYQPFIKAIGSIRRANGDPTAWALNAATDEQLNLLTAYDGNPLQVPKVVEDLNRMISNQLPFNDGDGLDESTSIIYDPNALLIGMQSPIKIEVSREAEDAFKKGLVYLRVYSMIDIAVLRPKHIAKITGLKAAETVPVV